MNEQKNTLLKMWPVTVLVLSLAISALTASSAYRYGTLHSVDMSTPTISVTGEGEATALPDIATITFTINQVSPNVKDAQAQVEATMKKVSDSVKTLGIESKDVKTENYTVNPKYTYSQVYCFTGNCPVASPKLEGYEVSEMVSVKVRKIDIAGDVLALLGKNEVKDIQGPNFSVENDDTLVKTARAEAITKAEEKARETAKALGVNLGEIRTYTEGGNAPHPMMYSANGVSMDEVSSSERVTLAPGESKVKVSVSLVYALR